MAEKNDGGPAFPEGAEDTWGMSLRDYFAAASLTGLVAKYGMDEYLVPTRIALDAYALADAMIKARETP